MSINIMRYGRRGQHASTHSSPDSVSAATPVSSQRYPSSEDLRRGGRWAEASSETQSETELLDIWDHVWFGVGTSADLLPLGQFRHSSKYAAPSDPLANVLPFVALPVANESQQIYQYQQQQQQQQYLQPLAFQNTAAAGSTMVAVQQYQLQPAYTGSDSKLMPLQQQHPVAAPAVEGVSSSADDADAFEVPCSSISFITRPHAIPVSASADQQEQQQQAVPQQQDQQQHGLPLYVLGTWTQRQYILPDRQQQQTQEEQQQQQQQATPGDAGQSIPLIGRWTTALTGAATNSHIDGHQQASVSTAAEAAQQQDAAAAGDNLLVLAAAVGAAEDPQQAARRHQRHSIGTDEEEEAVMQAAWRWRFAKRWQAEQTRNPADAAAAVSIGDGGMEEALQYLAACGENWHLARVTSSAEPGTTQESRVLGTLGTPSLLTAELLVEDGSYSANGSSKGGLLSLGSGGLGDMLSREVSSAFGPTGRGRGGGEATQQVTGMAKRAAELLAKQNDIHRAASERWREAQIGEGCDLWVGALMESVEVDDWGKFKWLLLRLRDRSGRQKLLVRGANYASDAKIVEGLHRQMMAACAAHDVRPEAIEVVGGGLMEWRRHRDRHLHISGGYVSAVSGPGGPSNPVEVMNLAAVLTKQHLPMHYKVTSDGGKAL